MKINPFDKIRVDTEQSRSINPNIFKAYDIRGIYPKEINEETAYLIGRAFVRFLNKKNPKIVVGRDGRLSSSQLFKALTKGIIDQGGNVIDIGLSTSPMLYFATAFYKFDGGIEISASHNPPQFNGFKIVREKAIPISQKTGLKEIKMLSQRLLKSPPLKRKGRIIQKKALFDYLKFNLKFVKIKRIKPLKIVFDTANAVPGILIPEISRLLYRKVYHLFSKLDGNFPNHLPDPSIKENLKTFQKEVIQKKADLGVAFDGDGDRIIFVDEKGEIVPTDSISALISLGILKENPGQKILYDIRSSRMVKEIIKKNKGKPTISRVGHSFIKEKMRKENIIFGGELSGHYYHRDHYFSEAPLFILFKILEEISKNKKSFSTLTTSFKKYFHSGEINFKIKDKGRVLKKLERKYKNGKTSHLDGFRVDYSDWWFNVRPSQTEPLLRLVVEAETKRLLKKKKKELTRLIRI